MQVFAAQTEDKLPCKSGYSETLRDHIKKHTLTHLHVSILSLYDAVVLVAVAELREATFVGL